MKKAIKKWYKLDNSAIAFAATLKKRYACVFRYTIKLKEIVDPDLLQQAFERVWTRFPYFAVTLRKGLFWTYLEETGANCPRVKEDIANPCKPINLKEDEGHLMRVFYYEKSISVEFFHVMADGTGAGVFLRTLCAEYLRLKGVEISPHESVFDIDSPVNPAEYEDSYFRYGKSKRRVPTRDRRAYRMRSTPEANHTLSIISGVMPLDKLLALAKKYGVTITEYLAAVFLKVLYDKQKSEWHLFEKPIKVGVPVNLRRFFPSQTLRNFISMVSPYVDPNFGDYTFEEIVNDVKNYMHYAINPKFMRALFTMNIRTETNPVIKVVPYFLKKIVVSAFFKRLGGDQLSGEITNPGEFKVPPEMAEHMERAEVLMGKPHVNMPFAGFMTFKNTAVLAFTSSIVETDVERGFFRYLIKEGIPVKIESNRY